MMRVLLHASLFPSASVGFGPALTRQSVPALLHLRRHLLLRLTFRLLSLLHSIQFCCFIPITLNDFSLFTSAHCCRPNRLDESGLSTPCPCQLKVGPVSSRQIHHVHFAHFAVHVQLDHCAISNISNVRILFDPAPQRFQLGRPSALR